MFNFFPLELFVSLTEMVGPWPVLLLVVVCLFARDCAYAYALSFVIISKKIFIWRWVFPVLFLFCFLLSYCKISSVAFCCLFYDVFFVVLFLLSRVFVVVNALFWLAKSLE